MSEELIVLGRYFKNVNAVYSALHQAGYSDPQKVYSMTKRILAKRSGLSGNSLFQLVSSVLYPVTLEKVDWSVKWVEEVPLPELPPPGDVIKAKTSPSRRTRSRAGESSPAKSKRPDASAPVDLLSKLAKRKCPLGKSVDWVMQHLDDPDPDPDEIPSLAAWSLRRWALESAVTRSEFYRTFACKRLPTQRMIEIQEKMKDDGRDIDERILEVIAKREAMDDDEVQSEGPEEDFDESDLPPEFY